MGRSQRVDKLGKDPVYRLSEPVTGGSAVELRTGGNPMSGPRWFFKKALGTIIGRSIQPLGNQSAYSNYSPGLREAG